MKFTADPEKIDKQVEKMFKEHKEASLEFCNGLKVASAVLEELRELFSIAPKGMTAYIESYSNGREQGYCLQYYNKKMYSFSFAENRNSDDIVVYSGESSDFNTGGNIPSDKIYRRRGFFQNPKAAAQDIFSAIMDLEKKETV